MGGTGAVGIGAAGTGPAADAPAASAAAIARASRAVTITAGVQRLLHIQPLPAYLKCRRGGTRPAASLADAQVPSPLAPRASHSLLALGWPHGSFRGNPRHRHGAARRASRGVRAGARRGAPPVRMRRADGLS